MLYTVLYYTLRDFGSCLPGFLSLRDSLQRTPSTHVGRCFMHSELLGHLL